MRGNNLRPGPAALYKHDHPPVINPLAVDAEKQRLGQKVADKVASIVGGWPFIIFQSTILCCWIAFNIYVVKRYHDDKAGFDPYPFILLNLMLSFQAAYTGPIVMMSQNRQNEKDRLAAQSDFDCNKTAEEEVRVIMEHLVYQDEVLHTIMTRLDALARANPNTEGYEQEGESSRS
ncbi:MAG: hypothetical protein JWL77_131 [Chthonomonadaceae bacterium]|nr:hypothetical protein [Chthonomonadaceae bacterium]